MHGQKMQQRIIGNGPCLSRFTVVCAVLRPLMLLPFVLQTFLFHQTGPVGTRFEAVFSDWRRKIDSDLDLPFSQVCKNCTKPPKRHHSPTKTPPKLYHPSAGWGFCSPFAVSPFLRVPVSIPLVSGLSALFPPRFCPKIKCFPMKGHLPPFCRHFPNSVSSPAWGPRNLQPPVVIPRQSRYD
jgi:hypothetical protein